MHGTVAAVTALQKADLLVSLGARFDDRVTGKLSTFAPHALVVHADIDPRRSRRTGSRTCRSSAMCAT
jgi:acetolactate synthase-1/2/3 large subunit